MSRTFTKSQTLRSCLESNPQAASLLAQADRVLKASRVFEAIAPKMLALVSRVANIKDGIIIIHADHGAAASKLKQQLQHLASSFNAKGIECRGIEVRVQPSHPFDVSLHGTEKPISEQALGSLGQAAQKLPANSPLRAALQKLIDRATHQDKPA